MIFMLPQLWLAIVCGWGTWDYRPIKRGQEAPQSLIKTRSA